MAIEGFRLAPQQKHLWQQQIENPQSPYRAQALVRISGNLALEKLQRAIAAVCQRHEILHTTFQRLPGLSLPVQVIANDAAPAQRVLDFSSLAEEERERRLAALFQEAAQIALDLQNGPALHVAHVALAATEHALLLTLPGLCADAVGLRNLVQDIANAYATDATEEEDGVMQYADLAEWQNELLESEEGEAGRAFWRKQHAHLGELLRVKLPFENAQALGEFTPRLVPRALNPELRRRIETLAQQHEAEASHFLLACFAILLGRLSELHEVTLGFGSDGRKYEELRGALGLFAKYLPLPCELKSNEKFTEVLQRVQQHATELLEWQEFFSWDHVERFKSNGTAAYFPFAFQFEEPAFQTQAGGLSFQFEKEAVCVDRFKLKLTCAPHGENLKLAFHYDASLFAAHEIERFAEQYLALVHNALARPDAALGALEIVGTAERTTLLADFNQTKTDFPQDVCIHQLIAQQAERAPDKIAVSFAEQVLTYGELHARAERLAQRLVQLGITPEQPVAICLERSLEMIIGMLAILKAGGVYVPLDPSYPHERLAFMLEDTQAPVVLTQRGVMEDGEWKMADGGVQSEACGIVIVARKTHNHQSSILDSRSSTILTPGNLAYMIYTSGSTGKPKGVMVTHQNLVNSTRARIQYYREPVANILLLSSFAFDSSIAGIFWTLCQGGTLTLPVQGQEKDPQQILALIAQQKISHMLCLPSLHGLLLAQAAPRELASLRAVIVAGEACTTQLVETHHQHLPDTALYNEYGPTEGTVWSSVHELTPQINATVPIGRPIPNAQIHVLNEHLNLVPVNVAGELCVAGAGVARGYLKRPDLTAERFMPNAYGESAGSRIYKTGDLARWQSRGVLDFLGRLDHQVKIRGYRIELEEIENVLAQHEAVAAAVVHAREDQPGDKRLVAYLISKNGRPETDTLRAYLSAQLPDYMVPSAFVFLETMPLMPNGKVDRKALPAPEKVSTRQYVAPRTASEKILAEIWRSVLNLERVGIHDNYFELGGDSILTIRIIAQARAQGLTLTPRQFFQHQTIAELAEIASATGASAIHAEQGEVTGSAPLTPMQHWFFAHEFAQPDDWNMVVRLDWPDAASLEHWRKAVQALLGHHDALRLRFSLGDVCSTTGTPWQQTLAPLDEREIPFEYVDLSSFSQVEQQREFEKAEAKWQRSLNLSEGPLLRVVLFSFGLNKSARVLIAVHHLAIDVVSWPILLEDLRTALDQLARHETITLPRKTTSYKEWAERLREQAQSEELRRELPFWLSQARVAPMPKDFSKGDNTLASAQTVSLTLEASETQTLLQEVPKAFRAEMNDVLLAALALACAQWSERRELLVSLEGHGRETSFSELDVSRTVGWFTSMYPVLLKIENPNEAIAALQAVQRQLHEIPQNGFGYSLLRYLCGDRNVREQLRNLPQPEVNFNYLGQLEAAHLTGATPFQLARETDGTRDMVLEFVGFVVNGALQMNITYSTNLHRRATIEDLAQLYKDALRLLLAQTQSVHVIAEKPAPFSPASLSTEDLDSILDEINR